MTTDRNELESIAARVADLATEWGDMDEAEKRDAIVRDLRALARRGGQSASDVTDAMIDAGYAAMHKVSIGSSPRDRLRAMWAAMHAAASAPEADQPAQGDPVESDRPGWYTALATNAAETLRIRDAVQAHPAPESPEAAALTIENAPIGTKAPAIMGGHWLRVERGWQWNGGSRYAGSTFPRPGGDWNGKLIAPEAGRGVEVEALAQFLYEAWRAEFRGTDLLTYPWETVSSWTKDAWRGIARRLASAQPADEVEAIGSALFRDWNTADRNPGGATEYYRDVIRRFVAEVRKPGDVRDRIGPQPASAQQTSASAPIEIAGWVHEDQLPEGYPYEAMFPHSRVDGVRIFPVFAPAAGEGGEG